MEALPEGEQFVGTRGGGMDHAASLASREGCASLVTFDPLALRAIRVPEDWGFLVAHCLKTAEKSGAVREAFNPGAPPAPARWRAWGWSLSRLWDAGDKTVGRRKRLPHKVARPSRALWDRRCRLSILWDRRFVCQSYPRRAQRLRTRHRRSAPRVGGRLRIGARRRRSFRPPASGIARQLARPAPGELPGTRPPGGGRHANPARWGRGSPARASAAAPWCSPPNAISRPCARAWPRVSTPKRPWSIRIPR